MQDPANELRRMPLLRPSEKVHKQRSEGGYGRCTKRKKGLRVVCSATLQSPPTLFGRSL